MLDVGHRGRVEQQKHWDKSGDSRSIPVALRRRFAQYCYSNVFFWLFCFNRIVIALEGVWHHRFRVYFLDTLRFMLSLIPVCVYCFLSLFSPCPSERLFYWGWFLRFCHECHFSGLGVICSGYIWLSICVLYCGWECTLASGFRVQGWNGTKIE